MKKRIKYAGFILCLSCLCTGCLSYDNSTRASQLSENTIPSDYTEEQLIEIFDPMGTTLLRQITDALTIMEYTNAHNNANMKSLDAIPQTSEKVFYCKIYAKTDAYFIKQGVPMINTTEESLYRKDGNYYLSYKAEEYHDKTVNSIMYFYQVDNTLGEYLISLASEKGIVCDKEEIFKSWGLDDYTSETSTVQENPVEEIRKEEVSIVTPDNLAKVSKTQQLKKTLSDGTTVFETDNLDIIAQFHNHINTKDWVALDKLPEIKDKICAISIFQQRRKTSEIIMIESLRIELYQNNRIYYVSYIIPETDFSGGMNTFYKIPNDVAEYIKRFEEISQD